MFGEKMTKVILDIEAFKALASETRLDILRTLDGKKMSLNDISKNTNLHKVTLHEHLTKLTDADLVKRKERQGHKWVYYKLSWKGESLLHPENTRIVVLFSTTFIALFFGVVSLVNLARETIAANQRYDELINGGGPIRGPLPPGSDLVTPSPDPLFMYLTIGCLIVFSALITISFWRYKKNKTPRL
jgi:DNA-binding transcriptional ArsR family regulator